MKIYTCLLFMVLNINLVNADVAKIRVYKEKRTMQLLSKKNVVLYTYNIRLSLKNNNPFFKPAPKKMEGDAQTPEGFYKISKKRKNTNYPLSLKISYPSEKDKQLAKKEGRSIKSLGGMILIHGEPKRVNQEVKNYAQKLGIEDETIESWVRDYFYPYFDWTNGCIAVNNDEMEEIFKLIKKNTPIFIYP